MNLHGIVSGAIAQVNPFIPATIKVSTGYTTADSGKRAPTYSDPVSVSIQRQELSQKDLMHIQGLNVQGELASLYVNGQYRGQVRKDGKGGDIVSWDGDDWLVVAVPELWPDWCRLIVCLQR